MTIKPYYTYEIMDKDGIWTAITSRVQRCQVAGQGIQRARERPGLRANMADCLLTLENSDQAYNPDPDTVSNALLDNDRRIRIRYTGQNDGMCLQLQHDGLGGDTADAVISIVAAGGAELIGNSGGTHTWVAQSITPSVSGVLKQFTVDFGANSGAPSGTVTWELRNDAGGTSGPGATVYRSGTFTPTASATNTVNISSGPLLLSGVKYWLTIRPTSPQALNVFWTVVISLSSVYAGGNFAHTTDGGSSYTDRTANDLDSTFTQETTASFFSQSMAATISPGDILTLTWQARAQFDSQYNTDKVQIVSSSESGAKTLFTYTNKWKTYTLTFVATLAAVSMLARFIPNYSNSAANSKVVEYRNVQLTQTITVPASGNISAIGHTGAANYWEAQSFTALNGKLKSFTFTLVGSGGTPTGTMDWQIRTNNAGAPSSTILASGTLTPTPNAVNSVTLGTPLATSVGTIYWLVLKPTTAQTSGNYWGWKAQFAATTYAGGKLSRGETDGTVWNDFGGGSDADCTFLFELLTNGDFATGTPSPFAATNSSGITGNAAIYDNTNRDTEVWLRQIGGAGGTTTISGSPDAGYGVGTDSGGTPTWAAQSFQATAGIHDQITVNHGANNGAPSGSITWEIRSDSSGNPGAVLASGTYVPVASSNNTINVSGGIYLQTGVTYWLVLRPTAAQATNVYWIINALSTNPYANGSAKSGDATSWFQLFPNDDLLISIRTAALTQRDRLSQSFVNGSGATVDVTKVQLDLKKVGAPADTLLLRVETDASGKPSGTLYNANAYATVAESSLATSFGWIDFVFAQAWSFPTATTLHLVLSTGRAASPTDYVVWGADGSSPGYASGEMKGEVASVWAAESKDAIFKVIYSTSSSVTLSVIDDSLIEFNGSIEEIFPDAHARGGDRSITLYCVDFTQKLRRQPCTVSLQSNKRGDQIITELLSGLQTGTLTLTLPGVLVDTGQQTFPESLDGFTNRNSILEAIQDLALSEGPFLSFQWMDNDGTFRWAARDKLAKVARQAPRLTLVAKDATDDGDVGEPIEMTVVKSNQTRINQASLTVTPRKTITGPVVLGQITSSVAIPPKKPDGSPGTMQIILTFRDPDTGRFCGGKNVVTPLVATTDYLVFDDSAGTGFNYTTDGSAFNLTVDKVDATQITITLKNSATGTLYATKLQCRGDALVTYDPITVVKTHADVTNKLQQVRPYAQDMPFSGDASLAATNAQYLVDRYNTTFLEVQQITVDARAVVDGVDVQSLEMMDTILASAPQAGLQTPTLHVIVGKSWQTDPHVSGNVPKTLTIETMRIDDSNYAVWDEGRWDEDKWFV